MSEKPSLRLPASKSAAKTTGSGTASGTRRASANPKSKSCDDPDETFNFLAPAQSADELGRLAHYRVLKVLGRGGMGIVFMAEDTRLQRIVALKVMLPSTAEKAIARERFIREAHLTAAIEHDHIVTIYEVNADNPVPYLAMQFLKGMTLEDWLKAGKRLNIPQIMRIGKEIAKGLAAAHARQLIHRDIKPSNIWLDATNKGRVKILDFGLARPTNEETHLTQEGMILGSPAYMSPEQAYGQDVDERCDLFSLGCVLYRLCAGKMPFTGKDAMSMLLAITSEEPPALAQLRDDFPLALAELIHLLLAKKPENRPASAKDVVQAIQNIERAWIAGACTTATRSLRNAASGQTMKDEAVAVNKESDADPALEESAILDLELQPTPIPGVTKAPRSRFWVFAGLGCALMTVVSIFCGLGIAFSTNFGYVKISSEDDAAKDLLQVAGLTVWDHNKTAHPLKTGTQTLPAGGYHVDLDGLPKGWQIEPSQFPLHRGETLELKIRYVTPKSAPPIVMVTSDNAKKIQQEWAVFLKRDIVETTAFGPKMVLIPPGDFLMGSSNEQLKRQRNELAKKFEKKGPPDIYLKRLNSESPQHKVRITKPFYVSVNEVTHGQFSRFFNAKEYTTEPETTGKGGTGLVDGRDVGRRREFTWIDPGYKPTKDSPVTNITWKDAEAYCAWLSNKENKRYRLATEAEWEYACRAGTTTLWSFADDLPKANARDFMWFHWFNPGGKPASGPLTPQSVGRKKSNEFGLHDMHGNVAEMCSDYWGPSYYDQCSKGGMVIDPKGPENNPGFGRIVRGGSFLDMPFLTRSACRNFLEPTFGYCHVGFRIVCEVPLTPD
jgi:formylglycine-generating enzyme required for sulfatase activity/serine/threonine protein kinase